MRYPGKNVKIPKIVKRISGNCFSPKLESISIPNGVEEIGPSAFYGCSHITSIELPESVKKIGSGAFEECSSLETVTLPNHLIELETDSVNGKSEPLGIDNLHKLFPRCSYLDIYYNGKNYFYYDGNVELAEGQWVQDGDKIIFQRY